MASKGISKTLVWILMGLLILGLGGFGVTNLSGAARSVGSVGETEIDINEYARALQNEISALAAQRGGPVSFAQAQEAGLDRSVLSQLVSVAALEEESRILGVSIGDGNLGEQIRRIRGFQGPDGSFDRDAYTFALEQVGMSEAQFEEDLRAEAGRTILQGAVVAGVKAPAPYVDALLKFLAENRDITWAVLDGDDLETGLPVPSEEDLQAYHTAHPEGFTLPETKRLNYAWLTPDMIIDTVEVDEDALRQAYEERADTYRQPERRLVERLGFADEAAAKEARARIDSGEASFEDLVAERGLDLADVDMGDQRKIDLEQAGDAVFAATAGDIVGPLDTTIGPALFRVNAVLQAQETSFEDALPELRDELALDRARRVIDAQIENIDDLLAGGATIKDLASETEMQQGQIDWHQGVHDGIAAYDDFRAAAAEITEEAYPEVRQLDDGGIFAMELVEIIPPSLQPLDQVRDAVETAWRMDAVDEALNTQLQARAEELAGGASFASLGLEPQSATGLNRRGLQNDIPPEFAETVFAMSKGDVELISGGGHVFVLRLDDIRPPDSEDPDLAALRQNISDQTGGGLAEDLFQVLAADVRARAGITINEPAINAVNANFQ